MGAEAAALDTRAHARAHRAHRDHLWENRGPPPTEGKQRCLLHRLSGARRKPAESKIVDTAAPPAGGIYKGEGIPQGLSV